MNLNTRGQKYFPYWDTIDIHMVWGVRLHFQIVVGQQDLLRHLLMCPWAISEATEFSILPWSRRTMHKLNYIQWFPVISHLAEGDNAT